MIGPDETCDPLSRTLRIIQRKRGHRATSDDTLLAWAGVTARPDAARILDLGTGKGTVAMLVLSVLTDAECVGVEAFEQSFDLAVRNAKLNGLDDRFRPTHQDLRACPADPTFDLVMGAPPFMPLGTGVLPSDAQRAAGRFELRGGVEEYAACASRSLAPGGVAVLLMDGHGGDRCRLALAAAGLFPFHETRVRPRPDRAPTYVIWRAAHEERPVQNEVLTMRDSETEAWSTEYAQARTVLNLI